MHYLTSNGTEWHGFGEQLQRWEQYVNLERRLIAN